MREEQERADDRRDAAREMITLNRLGKRAVRYSGRGFLEVYWGWTDAASAGHLEEVY